MSRSHPVNTVSGVNYIVWRRTGLSFQWLTSSPDSQLFVPMVGRMRDARCRMVRRYKSAIRTGFGRVFITKFNRVWQCGRIFGRRGALKKWELNTGYMKINVVYLNNSLRRCWISERLLIKATKPHVVGNENGKAWRLDDVCSPYHKSYEG